MILMILVVDAMYANKRSQTDPSIEITPMSLKCLDVDEIVISEIKCVEVGRSCGLFLKIINVSRMLSKLPGFDVMPQFLLFMCL